MCRLGVLLLWLWGSAALWAQGAVLVVGGGSTPPEAYDWFVARATSKRVAVLDYANDPGTSIVDDLRAAGADVTYLAVTSATAANDAATADRVRGFDGLFFPGGDQWRYVSQWRNTLLADAIQDVFDRGGVIGGTSAGAAILGEVVFDARAGSPTALTGLNNPRSSTLTFTADFLRLLPGVLTDTHFFERGRLPRLAAFLTRYHADTGRWLLGLGVDDGMAFGVEPDGVGTAIGPSVVTVLHATDATTARVEAGQPLAVGPLRLVHLSAGFRFDLDTRRVVGTPPEARPFTATPFAAPAGPVYLDGSNPPGDFALYPTLTPFLAGLNAATDAVAVVTAPGATAGTRMADALAARGFAATLFPLDDARANDPAQAADLARHAALVFAGTDLATAAVHLDTATPLGTALATHRQAGTPLLLVSDDAKLFGQEAVVGTEGRSDAAFSGALTRADALHDGLVVIPRAYASATTYWENQASSFVWGPAQAGAAYSVLLPTGTWLAFAGPTATVHGNTPALFLDTRTATTTGFPFRRQNAAFDDARLHVVPPGQAFTFATSVAAEAPSIPPAPTWAVYPNPLAERATLALTLAEAAPIRATLFDLLGRPVATLPAATRAAGTHTLALPLPAGLAAGVYVLRLHTGSTVQQRLVTVSR